MLKLKNLQVGYGPRLFLENLDLELGTGELFGILGPNGSGKSTLMRCLAGLEKPLKGQIELNGLDLELWEGRDKAMQMSLLHREDKGSLDLDVMEYVLLGRLPHRNWREWLGLGRVQLEHAEKALNDAGCGHLHSRICNTLSDGEWQLVQFARALAQESRYILADEPAAHLDLVQRKKFHRSLRNYVQNNSCSILLISHELDLALEYCHRVLVLDGKSNYVLGTSQDPEIQAFIQRLFGEEEFH